MSADTEVVEKPAKEETVIENATPDYAAGLVSTQVRPAPRPTHPSCSPRRGLRLLSACEPLGCVVGVYMCIYIRAYICVRLCMYVCMYMDMYMRGSAGGGLMRTAHARAGGAPGRAPAPGPPPAGHGAPSVAALLRRPAPRDAARPVEEALSPASTSG